MTAFGFTKPIFAPSIPLEALIFQVREYHAVAESLAVSSRICDDTYRPTEGQFQCIIGFYSNNLTLFRSATKARVHLRFKFPLEILDQAFLNSSSLERPKASIFLGIILVHAVAGG